MSLKGWESGPRKPKPERLLDVSCLSQPSGCFWRVPSLGLLLDLTLVVDNQRWFSSELEVEPSSSYPP